MQVHTYYTNVSDVDKSHNTSSHLERKLVFNDSTNFIGKQIMTVSHFLAG